MISEAELTRKGYCRQPDGSWKKNGATDPMMSADTKPMDRRQKHKGWYDFPGEKRYYLKSKWELNYAKYLELLVKSGHIKDWVYEPDTFYFDGIKRGTTNYTPDFRVKFPDGKTEYVEVKGFWDAKSLTKVKRMAKYHPQVVLRIVDGEWFKAMSPKMKKAGIW